LENGYPNASASRVGTKDESEVGELAVLPLEREEDGQMSKAVRLGQLKEEPRRGLLGCRFILAARVQRRVKGVHLDKADWWVMLGPCKSMVFFDWQGRQDQGWGHFLNNRHKIL
jgi:hypothetical protein